MKRNLLSLLLVFVLVLGMLPVQALAADTPFVRITTADGQAVQTSFKGMVPAASEWLTYNDGPYYHVTVPAGTTAVRVTYPADVKIAGGSTAYTYTLSVPDYALGYGEDQFQVIENDDGTKTLVIPIAKYLLENGTGMAASAELEESFDPITFFSFSYEEKPEHTHTWSDWGNSTATCTEAGTETRSCQCGETETRDAAALGHSYADGKCIRCDEADPAAVLSVTKNPCEGVEIVGDDMVGPGSYSFQVIAQVGYSLEHIVVKVNGEEITAVDGSYTVESPTSDLTITVEGAEKLAAKPVTVYFSFSHDDRFAIGPGSDKVMALREIRVPYFDLAEYGLESYYFSSESYGDDGDGLPGSDLNPGTAEYAYGKVTLLHLYIYALERYYCGIDAEHAGQGYLSDAGLMGTDVLSISGSTGSLFMDKVWGYDLNLNYYVNYEYPLASEGWGSTSDQILLREGDIITLGHFTSWSFFSDNRSIFNYLSADKRVVEQGQAITLTGYLAGSNMGTSATTAQKRITYQPTVYVTAYANMDNAEYAAFVDEETGAPIWTEVGKLNKDGTISLDTTELAPGKYIVAIPGQYGEEFTSDICSAPGGVIIEVTAKSGDVGDVDGDGRIDMKDAVLVAAYYNELKDLGADQLALADVNQDGRIDMSDAAKIAAFYNESITEF